MISLNIATHIARKDHLPTVLDAVLKQGTRPDIINIYLNDYPAIPKYLKQDGINAVLGKDCDGDLGASAKFYFADKQKSGVYITLDDDLIPAPGYVGYLADMVMRYGSAVVGFHGTRYPKHPIKSYFHDGHINYFTNGLAKDTAVDMLGTGCMAFRIGINPTLKDFPIRNMVDPQFCDWAKYNGVRMVCLCRESGFVKEIEGSQGSAIWKGMQRDDSKQTEIINLIRPFRRLPVPKQYPVSSLDGWSMEWPHLKHIANSIQQWDKFVELGSGKSTDFWRHCGILATTFEHDAGWARKMKAIHRPIKDGWYDMSEKDLQCDVLLVDGPIGGEVGYRYNMPVEMLSKETRLIFVDDCHREKDMELAKRISSYIGRPMRLVKGKEKIMTVI